MRFPLFNIDIKVSEILYKKIIKNNRIVIYSLKIYSYILIIILSIIFMYYNLIFVLFSLLILIISSVFQNIFERIRPYEYFNIKNFTTTNPNKSFPSLHTVFSISLFLFFHYFPISYLLLSIPISRILSLSHWLSDIIFSILLVIPFYISFNYLYYSFHNIFSLHNLIFLSNF